MKYIALNQSKHPTLVEYLEELLVIVLVIVFSVIKY